MRSTLLPAITGADLSDNPAAEPAVPPGWPAPLVPNFSQWLPGDVVLVAADDGKSSLPVALAQRASRQRPVRQAASFTHAGLYLGDGMLVDATPADGVSQRSLWFYCQRRAIALRRLRLPEADGALGPELCNAALAQLGRPYSVLEAVMSKLLPATLPNPQRLYCSTFVGLVVAQATGVQLAFLREHRPLHPATLAVHPLLEPVELEWRPAAMQR